MKKWSMPTHFIIASKEAPSSSILVPSSSKSNGDSFEVLDSTQPRRKREPILLSDLIQQQIATGPVAPPYVHQQLKATTGEQPQLVQRTQTRGKEREVPKVKKPTRTKKIILQERESKQEHTADDSAVTMEVSPRESNGIGNLHTKCFTFATTLIKLSCS